mmetsp:Transcript_16445/g.49708  ORF Transcript_16445/g.49708 Transcript_16445/m.49708 type:complete len:844 (+) Transcript_16445:182-2713(+)
MAAPVARVKPGLPSTTPLPPGLAGPTPVKNGDAATMIATANHPYYQPQPQMLSPPKNSLLQQQQQFAAPTGAPPPKEASLLNLKELPRTGKRGAPQAFPHLLFLMLERESKDIIRWCPEGRAFMISDLSAFIANTLVKYFRHSRYASFQRQLNLYGFRKNESGAFEHKFFVREAPELLTKVQRAPQPKPKERKDGRPYKNAAQGDDLLVVGGEEEPFAVFSGKNGQPTKRRPHFASGQPPYAAQRGAYDYGDAASKKPRFVQQQPTTYQGAFDDPVDAQQGGAEALWQMFDQRGAGVVHGPHGAGPLQQPPYVVTNNGLPPQQPRGGYYAPAPYGVVAPPPQHPPGVAAPGQAYNPEFNVVAYGQQQQKAPPKNSKYASAQQQPQQKDFQWRPDEQWSYPQQGATFRTPLPPPLTQPHPELALQKEKHVPAPAAPATSGPPPEQQVQSVVGAAAAGAEAPKVQQQNPTDRRRQQQQLRPNAAFGAEMPSIEESPWEYAAATGTRRYAAQPITVQRQDSELGDVSGLTPTGGHSGSTSVFPSATSPTSPAPTLFSLPSFSMDGFNDEFGSRSLSGLSGIASRLPSTSRYPSLQTPTTASSSVVLKSAAAASSSSSQQQPQQQQATTETAASAAATPEENRSEQPTPPQSQQQQDTQEEQQQQQSFDQQQQQRQQQPPVPTAASSPLPTTEDGFTIPPPQRVSRAHHRSRSKYEEAQHVTFAASTAQPHQHRGSRSFNRLSSEDEASLLRRSISISSDDWVRGLDDTAEVVNTLANFGRATNDETPADGGVAVVGERADDAVNLEEDAASPTSIGERPDFRPPDFDGIFDQAQEPAGFDAAPFHR